MPKARVAGVTQSTVLHRLTQVVSSSISLPAVSIIAKMLTGVDTGALVFLGNFLMTGRMSFAAINGSAHFPFFVLFVGIGPVFPGLCAWRGLFPMRNRFPPSNDGDHRAFGAKGLAGD
ncbi:MAG: hypothetical protein IPN95_19585 [Bacteroidetes bacterium]|nr:hypothetical protein [Bacteroidota bacterium]